MLHKLLASVERISAIEPVSAHCDIPCKIYDPHHAQIAVLTMIRTLDLLLELNDKDSLTKTEEAQFVRLVAQKEEHGIKVKDEVRVIWGDYFKQPQFDAFPEIHELTHTIMLLTSKLKQGLDRDVGVELLEKVNRFAQIFWESKSVATYTADCPYPPALPVTYPDLKG
ncbi:superoxide dismutase, Ni [Veronia nyctiphanis]|uniref:Superoxide dismutase, Ni n=1 Tax=Veronia nyctiphanis TaxID=1278244 RepID=A0A4Q0YWW5_9GAMM|nr:superoxide dismutase, Ni [Veronia nyctiphanis]RXJ74784.1 superoxide dismutase, Ni [Veronia nyctiphanis]